jgi:hypothetical protein
LAVGKKLAIEARLPEHEGQLEEDFKAMAPDGCNGFKSIFC